MSVILEKEVYFDGDNIGVVKRSLHNIGCDYEYVTHKSLGSYLVLFYRLETFHLIIWSSRLSLVTLE